MGQRRAVAERDGLDRLDLASTLPRDPTDPDSSRELVIDVLFGGTLIRRMAESSERVGFALDLPRALERRETYEFGLRFRAPAAHPVRPHYTRVSPLQHAQFQLRVRLDPARPPRQI